MVLEVLIFCATLMSLWGATMLVWLFHDKPLVNVTVKNINTPTKLILSQRAKQVFT